MGAVAGRAARARGSGTPSASGRCNRRGGGGGGGGAAAGSGDSGLGTPAAPAVHTTTVTAVRECRLLRMDGGVFRRLLGKYTERMQSLHAQKAREREANVPRALVLPLGPGHLPPTKVRAAAAPSPQRRRACARRALRARLRPAPAPLCPPPAAARPSPLPPPPIPCSREPLAQHLLPPLFHAHPAHTPRQVHSIGGHGRVRLPAEYLPDRVLGHGAYGLILHANRVEPHEGAPPLALRAARGSAHAQPVGRPCALPSVVAIKRLRPFHFDVDLKALLRELSVLRHVSLVAQHPNLLQLLDVCPPPPGALSDWREVCLVLQAMEVRRCR